MQKRLEHYIVQANPLIEAKKHMNVTEMRLFGLGLSDIRPHITDGKIHDVDFHDTWITYKELEDLFHISNESEENNGKSKKISGGSVTNLKRQIKKAFQSYIEIPNDKGGFRLNHIYEEMEYFPQEGLLIRFHDKLKPYILDLVGKAYTSYKLKLLFLLSSEYSQRIMELLLKQKGFFDEEHQKVYYDVTTEELRRELDIPDNLYVGRMDNFKSRVLDLPIKEINEKTDYKVTYNVIKKGRRITGFRLWLEIKKEENAPVSEERKLEKIGQIQLIEPPAQRLSDEEQEAYDSLVNRSVTPNKAMELAKNYELLRIKSNLEMAVKQKDTSRNLPGLIISMIEQDTAGQQEIAKKEARSRIEARQQDRRQAYDDFHGTQLSKIGKYEGTKEDKKEEKAIEELTDLEVEMIIKNGENAGIFLKRMKKLGLNIDDVKAGRRK